MDVHALILDIFRSVLIVLIPIIAKYIVDYLSTKRCINYEEADLNLKQMVINDAISIVNDVVLEISQTYVESLKKSNKFTKEAQKEAFNMAYENATKLITKEARDVINVYYNDFDTWLTTQIEKSVNLNK